MAPRPKILFLEGIPKSQDRNEGKIIKEFTKLGNKRLRKKVELVEVQSKRKFLELLKDKDYRYIHISSHGYHNKRVDESWFNLPHNGNVSTSDINCSLITLQYKVCFISSCSLGNRTFVKNLFAITGVGMIIAPRGKVSYIDAAAFWIVLYYNHFVLGKGLKRSFNIADKQVKRAKMKYSVNPWCVLPKV